MQSYYRKQLAHIHDTYYGDIAISAAEEILKKVSKRVGKKVIDLGCGSGILASILSDNGMQVIGVDISMDLLEIAKKRSPKTTFVHTSLFNYKFGSSDIICAIGEPFNYLFDERVNYVEITKVFRNIYESLEASGCFLFDILTDEVAPNHSLKIIE